MGIGYLDRRSQTFYRIEQLDLSDQNRPVPKAGEIGAHLDAGNEAIQIDGHLQAPKVNSTGSRRSKYEKTADGFVWREGKRIGWVIGTVFYPASMLDIVGEKVAPRSGSAGIMIVSDNLDAAVAEAAKLYPSP